MLTWLLSFSQVVKYALYSIEVFTYHDLISFSRSDQKEGSQSLQGMNHKVRRVDGRSRFVLNISHTGLTPQAG